MRRLRIVVPMLLFCFFHVGCATDRVANRGSEKVFVQIESSEKYDALVYQLRSLEQSVSILRSEMATLEERLRKIRFRPLLTTYQLPKEIGRAHV